MRILTADDNVIVRVDLPAILEDAGHMVCAEAADGFEAVELARETRPDLAILDVRMPRLHGLEAARRIVRERPMPLVVITGYTDYALADLVAGTSVAASQLTKSFVEPDVLLALEAAVLQHAAAGPSRVRRALARRSAHGRGGPSAKGGGLASADSRSIS